jgi:hypothetical protein
MVDYYKHLGWRFVEGPAGIDQPSGRIISSLPVMVLPLVDALGEMQPIELRSLPW